MAARPTKLPKWAVERSRRISAALAEQAERGTAPWMIERTPGERSLPCDLRTGERFKTAVAIQLESVAAARGYYDRRWGTIERIWGLGGRRRRGQAPVEALRVKVGFGKFNANVIRLFNVQQTAGLNDDHLAYPVPRHLAGRERLDRTVAASGVTIEHSGGVAAYYDLARDRVVLPHPDRFRDPLAYYRMALHEIGHRTGRPARLNRSSLVRGIERGPDSMAWAREELQAEIASMAVGDRLGIGHDPRRHAGYADRWAKLLREDPVDILRACYRADQTVHLLRFKYQ